MRRAPALLLLLALIGGLAASSVHRAAHAAEWADAQRTHAADHHAGDGDHASAPCSDGDLHDVDCAICGGLSASVMSETLAWVPPASADRLVSAAIAYQEFRRAATPARGPPAVA